MAQNVKEVKKAQKADEKKKQMEAQFPTAKGMVGRPKSAFRS